MAQPNIQHSFNSGEWAPHLWARTDQEKYHSGAALLRNFFVDYRGGATTRDGTRYLLRGYKDASHIRMISFQASLSVKFAMEFGDTYVRFYANGAPVLETGLVITGATQANPCVVSVTNTYTTGDVDWVYISGVSGMTQLNGNYYKVHTRTGGTITLFDLFGNAVDSTAFGAWTSGGTTARVFTLTSPYAATDLDSVKFVQNINTMFFTHPSYVPYSLAYSSPTSWTFVPTVFGTQASTPTNLNVSSTLGSGSGVYYGYVVTSVDSTGEESVISAPALLNGYQDMRTVAGTNTITWAPQVGAKSYNVYKATLSYAGPITVGAAYGFIGNTTATSFADTNIIQDFSQPPPTYNNPFASGSQVTATTITFASSYTTAPTVTFTAAPAGGVTATGIPALSVVTAVVAGSAGVNYVVGDKINLTAGVVLTVATLTGSGVATVTITNPGLASTLPPNNVAQISSTGSGTGATFALNWGVVSISLTQNGAGYLSTPTITFSIPSATATATLGPASVGNPSVAAFVQQRFVLAGPLAAPGTLYFSQPGNYYNFNTSFPVQDDNSITASIVAGQLVNIRAMVPQPGGLIVLTDGGSFLINGGSLGSAITPASIVSNPQAFLGCNGIPPIVVNYDILYIQSKGSSVRDASYNFYANVFTGTDISVLASHLFFGYQITEWAFAEEPYKIIWAVRNDGVLLSLTFIKEQEFIGWARHDTTGLYKSICTIVESSSPGFQNFLYHSIQRTVNSQTVQYIEMTPARATSGLVKDYWTVDAGLQYSGSPATTFSGAAHLVGLTCTGLADGIIIPAFTMPASGTFTLSTPASLVTVGLAYTPDLQTLYIDTGTPTIQSKQKKLPSITLRVTETLGLTIGSDVSDLVPMKDLVRGNVGSMTNSVVTDLVTGDAQTIIDPKWQEQGQIFIRQPYPYPASILGYIPELAVGDTPK